jgi:hypothetical protein
MINNTYFDLRFAPNWAMIEPAREFLFNFLAIALQDRDVASQICIAAHELMENAIKYSADEAAHIQVELLAAGPIRLSVENAIRPEHVDNFINEVRAAQKAEDAFAFYQKKMVESLARADGKAGLGLARIRWESQMSLYCEVKDGVARITCVREPPAPADSAGANP